MFWGCANRPRESADPSACGNILLARTLACARLARVSLRERLLARGLRESFGARLARTLACARLARVSLREACARLARVATLRCATLKCATLSVEYSTPPPPNKKMTCFKKPPFKKCNFLFISHRCASRGASQFLKYFTSTPKGL